MKHLILIPILISFVIASCSKRETGPEPEVLHPGILQYYGVNSRFDSIRFYGWKTDNSGIYADFRKTFPFTVFGLPHFQHLDFYFKKKPDRSMRYAVGDYAREDDKVAIVEDRRWRAAGSEFIDVYVSVDTIRFSGTVDIFHPDSTHSYTSTFSFDLIDK